MDKVKRILYYIARILVGLTFTFSGFVKAIDPWGTAYKIGDYLEAMGEFMVSFQDFALFASFILCALELTIGLSLLFGLRVRVTMIGAALVLLFMTPLTLWIALENPVQDCGCFGDALILDNWTTFWKNIVLCVLIAFVIILRKSQFVNNSAWAQWIAIFYTLAFSFGLSAHSYHSLPIIDFRPYHIGANINKGMEIPEGAPQDEFEIQLIYDSAGIQRQFSIDNFPNDSNWRFVDQKSVLVKKGFVPPIHDFTIEVDGEDITQDVLADPHYSFLIISWDITKGNFGEKNTEKIKQLSAFAQKNSYPVYFMTASVNDDIEALKKKIGTDLTIAKTDKITLKTIVRYNPGVVLIQDGNIVNKWSMRTLPEFHQPLEGATLGTQPQQHTKRNVFFAFLIWFLPVLLLVTIDKQFHRRQD